MHAIPAAVLVAALLQTAAFNEFDATVLRVIDGDTVSVRTGDGRRLRVRMLNIDAPESYYRGASQEPWAGMAKKRLARLAPKGSAVRVLTPEADLDRHGRTLGMMYRGETNLNLLLVREGLALPYLVYPAMGMALDFSRACAEARAAQRGVFAPGRGLSEEPAAFRLRLSGRPPYWWAGNHRTRRFTAPEGYDRYLPEERIFFESEEQALGAGFAREK
jgi:endonuclease YncB( thermonuclease family)